MAFAFLHLPYHLLIALDHRPFHFALQPFVSFAIAAAMPLSARMAGAVSLTNWTAVVTCSSLNVEAAPKVLLR